VLVTVGFTAWRLLANLKALMRSLTELSERLAPTLQDLEARAQETAELGDRLQRRQAGHRPAGLASAARCWSLIRREMRLRPPCPNRAAGG